jgi:hypothetical protein
MSHSTIADRPQAVEQRMGMPSASGFLGGVTHGDRLMANESVTSSWVNFRSKPQGRRD